MQLTIIMLDILGRYRKLFVPNIYHMTMDSNTVLFLDRGSHRLITHRYFVEGTTLSSRICLSIYLFQGVNIDSSISLPADGTVVILVLHRQAGWLPLVKLQAFSEVNISQLETADMGSISD